MTYIDPLAMSQPTLLLLSATVFSSPQNRQGNALFVTPKLHDSVKVEFETGTSPDQSKIDDCGNASMQAS
jgi:hypothetical protein